MNKRYVVELKYGTSRGADTYGYGLATCLVDGKRMGTATGGGYDLGGTAFGLAMMKLLGAELAALAPRAGSTWDKVTRESVRNDAADSLYGFSVTTAGGKFHSLHLDGACGFESMRRVVEALGYSLDYVSGDRNRKTYLLTRV